MTEAAGPLPTALQQWQVTIKVFVRHLCPFYTPVEDRMYYGITHGLWEGNFHVGISKVKVMLAGQVIPGQPFNYSLSLFNLLPDEKKITMTKLAAFTDNFKWCNSFLIGKTVLMEKEKMRFYTPQTKFGWVYWSHPVRTFVYAYVCPCVTKSCPGYNFKSIKVSNFKLHTQIGHIVGKCIVQEP